MFALLAESVKVGACTVRLRVVLAVSEPEVPVMVRPTVVPGAELLAVRVSTLVAVVGLVPKTAVTPLGKPEAARVTLPLNPPISVTVMVLVPPAPPCVIVTLLGEAESVKHGVEEPDQRVIRPVVFGLPQPVHRSKPVAAEKVPQLPLVMSWKYVLWLDPSPAG